MKTLGPLCIVLSLAIVAVVVWSYAFSSPRPVARAGGPAVGMEEDPLASRHVIIGTVKAVTEAAATNGNPARVTLEVTEMLKGNLKGTVVVVWEGPSHGVDWGYSDKNPIVIKWAAQPAEKPRVGDAYILFGTLADPTDKDAKESQWFYTSPGGRMPVTPENRAKALEAINRTDDAIKAERDRRAVEAARHAAEVKQWRAGMTDEKLVAAIKEADFVALGKCGGGVATSGGTCTFTITEVLKGRKRKAYRNDSYYVSFAVSKGVAAVIDGNSEYTLLLSEKRLVLPPGPPTYQPVGEGVVLADAATKELVRESTKGLAGKGPPAVLVYPDDPALADALEAVAGGQVTVIRGQVFTGALPMDKIAADRDVDADFYLRIDRSFGKPRKTVKLELARSDATRTLLVDRTLTESDEKAVAADIIAAILKAK